MRMKSSNVLHFYQLHNPKCLLNSCQSVKSYRNQIWTRNMMLKWSLLQSSALFSSLLATIKTRNPKTKNGLQYYSKARQWDHLGEQQWIRAGWLQGAAEEELDGEPGQDLRQRESQWKRRETVWSRDPEWKEKRIGLEQTAIVWQWPRWLGGRGVSGSCPYTLASVQQDKPLEVSRNKISCRCYPTATQKAFLKLWFKA